MKCILILPLNLKKMLSIEQGHFFKCHNENTTFLIPFVLLNSLIYISLTNNNLLLKLV